MYTNPSPYDNPYSPAGFARSDQENAPAPQTAELASLLQRFVGAVLDTLLGMLMALPGVCIMIAGLAFAIDAQQRDEESIPETAVILLLVGLGLIAVGQLVMLGIQIFLLLRNSQTFGKYVMGTQVVDFESGQPANFVQSAVLRIVVNNLICCIPFLGLPYFLADTFFIFREDRRCIHDLLANTIVIDISKR
jgi:uncharacterized RDD family membrane protein YckC